MDGTPQEMIDLIIKYVTIRPLRALACTCKRLNVLTRGGIEEQTMGPIVDVMMIHRLQAKCDDLYNRALDGESVDVNRDMAHDCLAQLISLDYKYTLHSVMLIDYHALHKWATREVEAPLIRVSRSVSLASIVNGLPDQERAFSQFLMKQAFLEMRSEELE